MSDVSMSMTEKQHFHLGDFDGPLDLLLFLIKKSEVNIYDIPIASITEQYLSFLSFATNVDLDTMTEFYLMAATLLYIKSKMLLPVELSLDDELEDPRKELVEKLIEYQKFRKLSDLMADKEGEVEWIIERTRTQRILPFADEGIWEQVSVWDLLQTFSSLLSNLSSERIIDLYEEVSVNEKITLIAEILEQHEEFMFTDLVKKRTILEIVCSFWAVLELVKERRIQVYQNRLFGDIRIRARKAEPPTQEDPAAAAPAEEPSEQWNLAKKRRWSRRSSSWRATRWSCASSPPSPAFRRKPPSRPFPSCGPRSRPTATGWKSSRLAAALRLRPARTCGSPFASATARARKTVFPRPRWKPWQSSRTRSPSPARKSRASAGVRGRDDQAAPEPQLHPRGRARRTSSGKPVQYGTTREFLKAFRLNTISDLPKLDGLERERFEQE